MNERQWLEIADDLKNRIKREPDRKTELLLRMAGAYIKARYFRAAMMVCRAVLKIEPFNVKAILALGKCLLGLRKVDRAEKLFETVTAMVPSLPEAWWGLWACRRAAGRHSSAAEALESLLEKRPEDPALLQGAAEEREAACNLELAALHYERLFLSTGDENIKRDVAARLGRIHLETGACGKALRYLETALRMQTAPNRELLVLAAEAALAVRDYARAAHFATSALENCEFDRRAAELLGLARMELNEHDGAVLVFERLVDGAPDDLRFRKRLAEALYRAGELKEAEVEYSRCLARKPDDGETMLRLAEIAWKRRETGKAERMYERCLRHSPAHPLALFRLGLIKEERKLYPAAISCFRRLAVNRPDNARAHLHLGRCLRLVGSFDKARTHLLRAGELDPTFAGTRLELGLLDLELQRHVLAEEHFTRAVELDPEGETGRRAAYELRHMKVTGEPALAVGAPQTPETSKRPGRKRTGSRWIKLC